jgi:hypothetical protein
MREFQLLLVDRSYESSSCCLWIVIMREFQLLLVDRNYERVPVAACGS